MRIIILSIMFFACLVFATDTNQFYIIAQKESWDTNPDEVAEIEATLKPMTKAPVLMEMVWNLQDASTNTYGWTSFSGDAQQLKTTNDKISQNKIDNLIKKLQQPFKGNVHMGFGSATNKITELGLTEKQITE